MESTFQKWHSRSLLLRLAAQAVHLGWEAFFGFGNTWPFSRHVFRVHFSLNVLGGDFFLFCFGPRVAVFEGQPFPGWEGLPGVETVADRFWNANAPVARASKGGSMGGATGAAAGCRAGGPVRSARLAGEDADPAGLAGHDLRGCGRPRQPRERHGPGRPRPRPQGYAAPQVPRIWIKVAGHPP